MSQKTISSYFQRSSPLKKKETSNSNEIIEIGDSDDDIAEIEIIKPIKDENVPSKPPIVHKKSLKFKYDKHNTEIQPLTQEQEVVRQKFKRKLNQTSYLITSNDGDQDPDHDSEEEEEETKKPKKKQKKGKLTPLDEQVKTLKLNNLDKVLAIQVGYKYKFYCEDAVKVSKILNIMLIPGKINIVNETPQDLEYNKLAYCSIPEPRLHIHLQRLLDNGLKVGVVNQIETSTIKAVESGASSLFKRKLSDVFTRATYVEFDDKDSIGLNSNKRNNSIISLTEEYGIITLVSFQSLTGNIIYDEFEDTEILRTELKTRLSHLEPLEFLYFENDFTKETEKVIRQLNQQHNLRIIKYPFLKKDYYCKLFNDNIQPAVAEYMFTKSKNFKICCSLLMEYLQEFQLESAFSKRSNYIPFKETNSMIINSNTLENLEILENSTNNQQEGSLLWVLDHTRTKFGYRLLKKWILNPLIDINLINKRLDGIEEIKENFNHFLESIANSVLKNSQDLQKTLNRLNYSKINRKEVYLFLLKFKDLEEIIIKFGKMEMVDRLKSKYLKEIFKTLIEQTLDLKPSQFLRLINSQYALDQTNDDHITKYFNMTFLGEFIDISDLIEEDKIIEHTEEEFVKELKEIRTKLQRPSLEYVKKQNEPYLVEVRNALINYIPKDWIKINSTKTISRFRTPTSSKIYQKMKYHQERRLNILHSVFTRFTTKLNEQYEQLSIIIKNLAVFDCLLSISAISSNVDYSRPNFTSSERRVYLENSRNPIIESLNSTNTIVPNTIEMNENSSHLIITGPNMGGKSTIVKQVALIQIMAQIGCFIPAGPNSIVSCFNKILTRMGAKDDLIRGESTFFIEMSQVAKILKELESCQGNALVILDEVGRGTSTVDGISIAESILEYLLLEKSLSQKVFVLFITHFPSICRIKDKYPHKVQNYHMSFIENAVKSKENEDKSWPRITFLYELKKGSSSNSYGLNVANLAGIDNKILNDAFIKAKERQSQVELNKKLKLFRKAKDLLLEKSVSLAQIKDVLENID